ncbi:MAG TPA: flavoprotein [Phycisphaerae bacterium]|nr:flavoprotein [Phycisphaerae bacterium]HRR84067.1 flavoprotein [Phycisphaerae bacterium]
MTPSPSDQSAPAKDLADYEVLIGVAGGIAAYKVCQVVSRLVQRGCGVTVAMTDAAARFVTPLTFRSLTRRQVFTSMWQAEGYYDPQHLALTERADLFLIAPATANLIGKFACGIADDLVSTLMVGRDCPAVLAPAMNTRMWENPVVQRNVKTLRELGYQFIDPVEGYLACGALGAGRMAEPEVIVDKVARLLKSNLPRAAGGRQ